MKISTEKKNKKQIGKLSELTWKLQVKNSIELVLLLWCWERPNSIFVNFFSSFKWLSNATKYRNFDAITSITNQCSVVNCVFTSFHYHASCYITSYFKFHFSYLLQQIGEKYKNRFILIKGNNFFFCCCCCCVTSKNFNSFFGLLFLMKNIEHTARNTKLKRKFTWYPYSLQKPRKWKSA